MARATSVTTQPGGALLGAVRIPGDKSVSHRAVMLASLASGRSRITGFLESRDCRATLEVMGALGVDTDREEGCLLVDGRGLYGLHPPGRPLDCASSGTTMRILSGVLAAQRFDSRLTGSPQLLRRPMGRIIHPLVRMGASISSSSGRAPLDFGARGGPLTSIDHDLPVASAQVKSCILMAGLHAEGTTTVREPGPGRDHTERMLRTMGARIRIDGGRISITPPDGPLSPIDLAVPGDLSSAAFLLVAATIVPGSEILLEGVGVNPTRTGVLEALRRMGARIEVENVRERAGEPVADIAVRASELEGASFEGEEIVRMMDEIPVLALAATQANGETVIRGAAELRVKETDRIGAIAGELGRLGASIETLEDGMIIRGPTPLAGSIVESRGDHRIGMTLAVAGLVARGHTTVREANVAADSFPGFEACLGALGVRVEAS